MSSSTVALHLRQRGKGVAALQQKLAELGYSIQSSEREKAYFGTSTREAVTAFQQAQRLEATGEACPKTMKALAAAGSREEQPREWAIYGLVKDAAGLPVEGAEVAVLQLETDKVLATAITGADGSYRLVFLASVLSPALSPVNLYFTVAQAGTLLLSTKNEPMERVAPGRYEQNLVLDADSQGSATYIVQGYVFSERRLPLPDQQLVAVDVGLRGTEKQLGKAVTAEDGSYRISFSWGSGQQAKEKPDIQIKVVAGENGQQVLGRSPVRYNAGTEETLHVVVASENIAELPEYKRLRASLTPLVQNGKRTKAAKNGRVSLSGLKENAERHDITYLGNKAGWDARMVAMMALADRFSDSSGIRPELYYALFRAGLPANPERLARIDPNAVKAIWSKAVERNIIPAVSEAEMEAQLELFKDKSALFWLSPEAPLKGLASLDEMLSLAIPKKAEREAIIKKYYNHAGHRQAFWEEVADEKGEAFANGLRLLGQLSFLTLNNRDLVGQWLDQGIESPLGLVRMGYYKKEKWGNNLAVPPEIPGRDEAERRNNYISYMIAQLKASYPTAIVAAMIDNKELKLGKEKFSSGVRNFLTNENRKFELGLHPVNRYRSEIDDEDTFQQLQTLQRVYQITPSDEAMQILLENGFHSARAVAACGESRFTEKYQELAKRAGLDPASVEKTAQLIFLQAQRVSNVALNVAASVLLSKNRPGLYSLRPSNGADLEAYDSFPTFQELFGAMDFCDCEHCRSWLSPAAYFVDLLEFIKPEIEGDPNLNPQDELFGRRPDLKHLELSCENTNTVLPYVDLANEIMEHYVAHESLATFKGFNLDENDRSDDLLANPQHVKEEAYNKLKDQKYPFSLPFNRSLEALRLYFKHLDAPLAGTMEALIPDEIELEGEPYGWKDIYLEQLNISQEEYGLLTDDNLEGLYGFDSEEEAIVHLTKLVNFARRAGVTYKELIGLAKTRFINPGQTEILYDPEESGDECCFEAMEFKLEGNTEEKKDFFIRLHRFIRLWKKLGWTVEELDKTITAFGTPGMEELLIRIAQVNRVMEKLGLSRKKDHLKVLALWSDIDTHGPNSLYRQLFLNPSVMELDDIFKDSGLEDAIEINPEILDNSTGDTVEGHKEALLAAFNLSSEELDMIIGYFESEDTFDGTLKLSNLSLIHRYAFFARALSISIRELLFMIRLTETSPFVALENVDPTMLRFIGRINRIREAGFKISHLAYYLQHEDWSGEASPKESDILAFAKTIRDELRAVEEEHPMKEEPSEEEVKNEMIQLCGEPVTNVFFELLKDETETPIDIEFVIAEKELRSIQNITDQLNYFKRPTKLVFKGAMTDAQKVALKGIIISSEYAGAFEEAIEQLFTDSRATVLSKYFLEYEGLDLWGGFEMLTGPFNERLEQVLAFVRSLLLPKLKRQRFLQLAASALSTELEVLQVLLTDPALLAYDALEDFLNLAQPGVSGSYYFSGEISEEDSPNVEREGPEGIHFEDIAEEVGSGEPLSARWQFYFEVPDNGTYEFAVETDSGAIYSLTVDGETSAEPIQLELEAGRLYEGALQIENFTHEAKLYWKGTRGEVSREVIPPRYLYPFELVENFRATYLRLLKVVAITEQLDWLPEELKFFGENYKLGPVSWLNSIPAASSDKMARHLFGVLEMIMKYAEAKKQLAIEDSSLIHVFRAPRTANEVGDNLLLAKMGWEEAAKDEFINEDGELIDEKDKDRLEKFLRIKDKYELAKATGLSTATLLNGVANHPDGDQVKAIKAALRAKYDERGWRKLIQPINDELRNRSRDALVAYILHQLQKNPATAHIDTADKLFEYFLIDVQMDACMKTSRIKQAISSVQLFITRCLMNLEPQVSPAAIDARQWEWMKRYRVWEANRKVFLFPENWLEPELRDDKSPIFRELESELLESDITEDSAVTAFYNYLAKLDEVARLEIVATCYQESEDGLAANDIVHVFGKTPGNGKNYYYRRREYGMWTPWEKVDLEIEGEPILPVIWNGQLFLFWLSVVTKPQEKGTVTLPSALESTEVDVEKVEVFADLHWSEHVRGKWQAQRSSDPSDPVFLGKIRADQFSRRFLFLASLEEDEESALYLQCVSRFYECSEGNCPGVTSCTFTDHQCKYVKLYTKHCVPEVLDETDAEVLNETDQYRLLSASSDGLVIRFKKLDSENSIAEILKKNLFKGAGFGKSFDTHKVLQSGLRGANAIFPRHDTFDTFNVPFFYQDNRHVFFVLPRATVETVKDYGSLGSGEPAHPEDYDFPEADVWVRSVIPNTIVSETQFGKDVSLGDAGLGVAVQETPSYERQLIRQGVEKVLTSGQAVFYDDYVIGAYTSIDHDTYQAEINEILSDSLFR
ncbi:MAG: peptidoglycan-binding protein [Phaeodactylibacter sp.]|nr:peptidoglycan-binding protein [Phaeodactylibacter sp.]